VPATEPMRRGRPAREPIRYAVRELQELISYLQHNLAKQSSVRDVYKTIEQRRAVSNDPRLRAYQWHSFSDRWFDAVRRNILPSWELLVRPWALALGGEDELAVVERLYNAIGPVETKGRLAAAESAPRIEVHTPPSANLTGHAAVDALLSQIVASTAGVVRTDNPLFIDAIMPRLDEFSRSIRPWRDGSVEADSSSYDSIMIRAFREAADVKATSIPAFMSRWMQSYGDSLMAAQVESGARVTRMFIFDTAGDALAEAAQRVMLTQVLVPTTILIYLRDEATVSPPAGCGWDFAVLDYGAVITEALFHDGEYNAQKLHFGNADAAADYQAFFERLTLHSMEYGRFMARRGGRRELRPLLRDLARLLRTFGTDATLAALAYDLAAAIDETTGPAERAELCERITALLDRADGMPLYPAAAGSVPSTHAYLMQALRSAVRVQNGRGAEQQS
jgi:hypothetical protein